jgi:Holliday junction resolvase RusA-like endonuclease
MATSESPCVLHIPHAPMPTPRPRFNKWGSVYHPKTYKDYLKVVKSHIKAGYGGPLHTRTSLGKRRGLMIHIIAIFPRPKKTTLETPRPDCDNIAKGVLDAMHDVVYDDDTVVARLAVGKYWGHPGEPGRIQVVIENIDITDMR